MPFAKILSGRIGTVPGNMRAKFEVCCFIILELLAINNQKCRGHDRAHAPFQKILRGHVRATIGNMQDKSEVCSFNRFGTIST